MKKSLIKVLSVVLVLTLLSACLGITAGAELKLESKELSIHTGIRINVDGKEFVPVDSDGAPVEVFLYNGTTYLPVRGISNLFGLGIEWDNETKSVYLGTREGADLPLLGVAADVDTSPFAVESKTITAHTGVSIYYNDTYFTPTGSDGEVVEVFLYNGTTYLPVRAISKLMNAEIDWDQANKTVLLSVPAEEEAPSVDYETIVKAAETAAKVYTDMDALVLPYYRYYLKVCAVLEAGLSELRDVYQLDPTNELALMELTAYVNTYDAFEREFGTYIKKSVDLYELAKTVEGRIKSYAADGYTADELETLETNTGYLKENAGHFSEYLKQGAPDLMMEFMLENVSMLGNDVVVRIGDISLE